MAILWEEKLDSEDDSEPHWSTSTIMAIFMASCLVTAVFFGLGYSFGRGGTSKAMLITANVQKVDSPATSPSAFNQVNQSPALREIANIANPVALKAQSDSATPETHTIRPAPKLEIAAPVERAALIPVPEHATASRFATREHSRVRTARIPANSHYMVQVGAVGNRKDARLLVSQLRRHGIHAGIYPGKHDRFLHVQIGPFASEQQALTVRHRIVATGYRAILKRA